mgnify:CR=1 FL=1
MTTPTNPTPAGTTSTSTVNAGQIWFDGKLVPEAEAKVSVMTHALHYGTSVFEGIRVYKTDRGPAIFRLREHAKRLLDSARILLMRSPVSVNDIEDAIIQTVRANGLQSGYVRPLLWYGAESLGINPGRNQVHFMVATMPWGSYLGEDVVRQGAKLMTSSWRRSPGDVMPTKSKAGGNYINSVLANQEARENGFDEALLLDKEADPGPYVVGDRISYTLTITNPNDVPTAINVTDVTPAATAYIGDTTVFSPEGATPRAGSEPRQDEPGELSWRSIVVPAGETITISYELRVLPGATSPLVNTASIVGTGVSAEATESVFVEAGVFDLERGLLIGRVYLDVNRNHTFDEGIDVPLPGARVVLGNGWQTLTDAQGNYAFRDLETGTWTVMVDQVTTPYTPSDHPEQLRDPRQHRVHVQGLTVSDFPFADLAGLASTRRETTVNFGPIELHKYQLQLGDTTRVVMEVSSTEPWPPLLITDPVPGTEAREFVVELSGEEPVFLTYDSDAVDRHDVVGDSYIAAMTDETTAALSRFESRLTKPLEVEIRLILLPLESKARLVELMHAKLKALQGI